MADSNNNAPSDSLNTGDVKPPHADAAPQAGGGDAPSSSSAATTHITLKVGTQNVRFLRATSQPCTHNPNQFPQQEGEEMSFKLKRTTQFQKLMQEYLKRQGLVNNAVRFLFDGKRLMPEQVR